MRSGRIGEAANEANFFKASEILYGKSALEVRCGAALVEGADFCCGNSGSLSLGTGLPLNNVCPGRDTARGGARRGPVKLL
jgi:hypothetical protein